MLTYRTVLSQARRPLGRISVSWYSAFYSHVGRSRAYSIALVGLGYRGYRSHFLSLFEDPSFSVTAVCDTDRVALEAFSAKHQGIPSYCSLPQLLQSHTPDFAIVAVPHRAHIQCIATLAAEGIAVLKEKPVAESIAEYEWMTSLPVRIGVTFQKRFEPHFLHFKSLIPLVGDVAAVEASLALNITNLEETWRAASSVGVTEDLGCHMLDMLVWLFGPPTSVMAQQVSSVRPGQRYGGDDVSDIIMDWGPKHYIGHVRLSRVAHRPVQIITVTGTKGTLHLDNYEITHHDSKGCETLRVKHEASENQVVQTMAQGFGDWVSGRQPEFSASLAKTLHTVSVMDATKASLVSRQVQHPLLLSSSARRLGAATNSRSLLRTARGSQEFAANLSTSSFSTSFAYSSYQGKSFRLNTGAPFPAVGLGTRRAESPGQIYEAVRAALDVGYRHIDTAQSSGNEHEIGRAIRDSGVPRRQIWITTKLDNRWHTRVESALQQSLGALDVDYVDLYLMHWPVSVCPHDQTTQLKNWTFVNTWETMQLLDPYAVRNIGVSNFGIVHLQQLLSHPSCKVVPAVNQIELHPYWPSRGLLAYCTSRDIHCTAYSCLGSTNSPLLQDQAVLELSRMKDKTPQQILIKWALGRGTSVVPKSVSASRIRDNINLYGWDLSLSDIAMLNSCSARFKSCNDDWLPGKAFFGEDG